MSLRPVLLATLGAAVLLGSMAPASAQWRRGGGWHEGWHGGGWHDGWRGGGWHGGYGPRVYLPPPPVVYVRPRVYYPPPPVVYAPPPPVYYSPY